MISAMELLATMGCWRAVGGLLTRWETLTHMDIWHSESFDVRLDRLRDRLREAEVIEAQWGVGSLLDLDHADVRHWMDFGLLPKALAETAKSYRSADRPDVTMG